MGYRGACFNPLPSPKQGETHALESLREDQKGFNPLPSPKQGETRASWATSSRNGRSFNPLPSPKQGETPPDAPARAHRGSFNPLPSPKQGETSAATPDVGGGGVSIRSPHQSKGRPSARRVRLPDGPKFQSAPLTKARGDDDQAEAEADELGFQSAPLTKARGDAHALREGLQALGVSIRSPHQSKGRPTRSPSWKSTSGFQSAPLTKARGDTATSPGPPKPSSFNPLPSPKQGETKKRPNNWGI